MSRRPRGVGMGVPLRAETTPDGDEPLGPLARLQMAFGLRQTDTPAILAEKEAAQLLGVNPDIMREFRRLGLVEPLGDYGEQVPKRYSAVSILKLMVDEGRLRAMDAAQTDYWKRKNAARSTTGNGNEVRAAA